MEDWASTNSTKTKDVSPRVKPDLGYSYGADENWLQRRLEHGTKKSK